MMRIGMMRMGWVLLLGVSLMFVSGCKKTAKVPAKRVMTKKKVVLKQPAKGAKVHWAVGAYEVSRLALAADDLAKAKSGASALAKLAGEHAAKAKDAAKASFEALKSEAEKLSKSADIAAARVAFGEVSKQLIGFLAANSGHASGVTAYFCPMAKKYKKWIQADKEMANPYMGKKMLKCGGKAKLAM